MLTKLTSKSFLVGLAITIFVIGLNYIRVDNVQKLLQRVEGILYDTRLLATLSGKKRQFDEQVIIIDIDEKSMREQGRHPWSRSKVSELVTKLMDAGVVVVAFDIFFAEPERNPVEVVLAKNKHLPVQSRKQIQRLADSVDFDKEFADTLSNSEVVLGFLFDDSAQTAGQLPKSVIDWKNSTEQLSEIGTFQHVLGNIATLQSAATGAGFINSVPESDGFIRKASLVLNYQGQLYPSLALEAARVYTLADSIQAQSKVSGNRSWLQGLSFGSHFIPTNEKGQIFIPYKGRERSFPYISATDVLNERADPALLNGAVAFIGTSAVGLADLRTTSVGVQYPGVEVHANVFEGLIHPEILPVELDVTLAIVFSLLLLTGFLLAILMVNQGPGRILLISLVSFLLHVSINWYCWWVLKISLPLFQILLLIALLTAYYGSVGFMSANVNRKKIKSMFDQYVPPAYIEKLIHSAKGVELKTERREMSVLFADIRDFTTLSEQFTPEELSEFLKEYLTEATSIIFDNKGTIDKYVGDMVMAIWNAPLEDENHAVNAVISALNLISLTHQLSKRFVEKDWPKIKLGIGISTGEMVVGDMGSTYRKAYTVLGDAVNLGSRIESLTKYYGVDILISSKTYHEIVKHGVICIKIDRIKVKGKLNVVEIYQPLGFATELSDDVKADVLLHEKAIEAYLAGDWQAAHEQLLLLKQSANLPITFYSILLERIANLVENDDAKDWDGVYTHESK
ncbi:adenylate/guanylate cyclase domain-containing protein [Colwellia sp. BRX10-3]|uniref:CHASE2 domain-containing protein n=1 Tax=Colwellia sp. BRX10-3 TaxID=2759844 RepID=UPI0015F46A71|nr:adenylate/guanylate cyclase domain-containing protein [Colwellia sp. BRX10-3]MBA6392138.1 adenylate/guanylate cyclase domain-containing protein [Colwellia sp. BRX10-3]